MQVGNILEAFAERHARREMTALLARVPRTAVRHRQWSGRGRLDLIVPGDRLLIRQGDVIPVDGVVCERACGTGSIGADGQVDPGPAARRR